MPDDDSSLAGDSATMQSSSATLAQEGADVASYPAPYPSPEALRSALVEAEVLVPAGVDGLYHRSAAFEEVARAVESYAANQRTVSGAPRRFLPPVMAREDFLRTDYLRSFPDLAGSIDIFTGDDRAHRRLLAALDAGEDWTEHLTASEVMLCSSICHPVYGTLDPAIPGDGLTLEASGIAFRHEPSLDPARMQSFRQYEFILVGTPAQALAHRDLWRDRAAASLAALDLPVRIEVANDPFFGRVGTMLSANQRDAALKFEILCDLTSARPTAIASSNYHEDHFGLPFTLLTPDGATAHSACVGFGLERIALALFAHHGLSPATWPRAVRQTLAL